MTLKKRLIFTLILVLLIGVVAETGAYFTYWAVFGARMDFDDLALRRAAILAETATPEEALLEEDPFQERTRRTLHPYLGFVRRPSVRPAGPFYGVTFDNNPIHRRAPDRVIIAIVGGSVAAGFRDERLATLVEPLSASPRFAGKEIIAVTIAQAGYKQPQQLLALNYLLSLGAEFDLVINLDGFNEVALHPAENAKKGIAAVYPRNWYRWAVMSPDQEVLRRIGERVYYEGRRARAASAFNRVPAAGYSPIANLVWSLADRAAESGAINADLAVLDYAPTDVPWDGRGPAKDYTNETEMMQDLVGIWGRCSVLIDTFCRGEGIPYFHFLQPNQYVPDSKTLSSRELDVAYREDAPYAASAKLGYPLLIEEGRRLKERGIRYFDLSNVFLDVEDTLYVDTCCHFNKDGYQLVGAAIAQAIVRTLDAEDAAQNPGGSKPEL